MPTTDVHPVGSLPPVGEIPTRMLAQVVRQDRLGDPIEAFRIEEIDTPSIKADEVLVGVMAAGINYSESWRRGRHPPRLVGSRRPVGEGRRGSDGRPQRQDLGV